MKKVKTFLILIVLCLLCGCQNTNSVPTIEKVGEVVVLQDNLLYVSPSDKLGSYDFELDDVSLVEGYKIGDIVKIKFYAEEKEDLTGKKYNIYHLVSIEPASGFYEDEITLNDLIDFDVNEILVQYDNNDYLISIYDDGAKELLSKWSDIKIYKDFIPVAGAGCIPFDFEIKGDNKSIIIQDREYIEITINGETNKYAYHRVDGYLTFSDIFEEFYESN